MAWETIDRRTVFSRHPYFRILEETIRTDRGEVIEDFYRVELREFVIIVPVLADGKFSMLRAYKHGPKRVVLAFPAGFVDAGEDPIVAAKRELLEETGLISQNWTKMGQLVDNGNQRGCIGHYFLAKNCQHSQQPAPGDHEDIVNLSMSRHELETAIRNEEMAVAPNLAAWGLALTSGKLS